MHNSATTRGLVITLDDGGNSGVGGPLSGQLSGTVKVSNPISPLILPEPQPPGGSGYGGPEQPGQGFDEGEGGV